MVGGGDPDLEGEVAEKATLSHEVVLSERNSESILAKSPFQRRDGGMGTGGKSVNELLASPTAPASSFFNSPSPGGTLAKCLACPYLYGCTRPILLLWERSGRGWYPQKIKKWGKKACLSSHKS